MSSHYVYVIVNKVNLKLYFGSHSWEGTGLDKNYYGSGTAIKRAVRKYGKDNFIVYPIKFYNTVDECRKAEQELLTKYDIANNIYCYNIKNGAVGWTSEDKKGYKHSENAKRKMSQAKKGERHPLYGKHFSEEYRQKLSQAHNYRKTPIVAIQKDTGKIRMFESQLECARKLNLNQGNILNCLKGKCKTYGGYTFKYIEQLESGIYEGITDLTLEPSKTAPTPVIAIQKDTGKIRIFESQNECSRVLGINRGNIYSCLKGRYKSAGGYTFKKINRDRRVFKVSQRSKADINILRGITE